MLHKEVTRWSCTSCGWDYYSEENATPRERALQACIDRDLRPRTLEEPDRDMPSINDLMEGMRILFKILPVPVTR